MHHRGFLFPVNYSLNSLFELIRDSLEDVLERRKIYINRPCGRRCKLNLEGSFADSELEPRVPRVPEAVSLGCLCGCWFETVQDAASKGKEERVFDVLEGDWQGNPGSKMLALPRFLH